MRDKHDRIWFPTVAGMVYFRPEALMGRHPESPPLLIERVHAADSTFRGFELPARLPPGLDHLDIDYNAPHFSTPERLHFQFQLEGFEEKWHETSTRRTAYYTNIPPGDYRFRLKVALSDGPWHELSPWAFEVEPFFYQRPAVHFTIAMLFLLLGFALHRIRLKRHTASEARLSQLVDTRTRELTELNQRLLNTREELMKTALQSGRAEVANNVVHNLGNALNSINVTMSLLEDDARALELERLSKLVTLLEVEGHEPNFFEENGKGQLAIRALAKLNRRLLSGRDKLTTDLGTLNEQLMHQNRIIRAQQNQVDHVDGFTETIDPNELIDELLVLNSPPGRVRVHKNYHDMPQLKLQRGRLSQTLFHLFNNAWESMNAVDREGLELQIKTYMNGEKLHIELMDNGEGIEQDHLNRIFFHGFTTRPYSDGFGLHYCANTVREMGGSLQITSDGRDRGVRVHLEVPYQRA